MISDQAVAGLTMLTFQSLNTIRVGVALLNDEAEVDRQSLTRRRSTSRVALGILGGPMELTVGANRAGLQLVGVGQLGEPANESMQVRGTAEADMAKTCLLYTSPSPRDS